MGTKNLAIVGTKPQKEEGYQRRSAGESPDE